MFPHDTAPIAAIATAPGRGGIGVIRISGQDLSSFALTLLKIKPIPRQAHYLSFTAEDGALIDKGIAIFFSAPHSYTGEDVLELQGHGGTAVMQALLSEVIHQGKKIGLRLAEPGEFSLRAFLNDKIDLVQAEAVSDLINASSVEAAQAAALSLSGQFSSEVNALTHEIVALRTLVEATLDFPEEEIEFIEKYQVKQRIDVLVQKFEFFLSTTKRSVYLSEGLRVVLAGEPNVGKSSLMNALFGEKIAIVSDIAGTTRDSIRDNLQLDGIPITVTDTAGLRFTSDVIEQLGIERTLAAIESSNVILDIVDIRQPESVLSSFSPSISLTNKNVITVFNKTDLLEIRPDFSPVRNGVSVSAATGKGLSELKEAILKLTGRQLGERSPWLARKRHVMAIEQGLNHLKQSYAFACEDDRVLDLLAEELRLCHIQIGTITGQMSADDLLGQIFSEFCIGK
jgi:tRNA modification GTPase